MSSPTSTQDKKHARTTPTTPSLDPHDESLHLSPDTEGSLDTPSPRKVTKIKSEDRYSNINEEAYIIDANLVETDPFNVVPTNDDDDSSNKELPEVELTNDDKKLVNELLKSKSIIPDSMVLKVMAQQQIPPEATSLEIDITKAFGVKNWQHPPAFWTGEAMKPNVLPYLLLPNPVFH